MDVPRSLPGRLARACLGLSLGLLLAGCMSAPPTSVHGRLGGDLALATVVGRTLDRAALDPRTRRGFDGVNLAPVKQHLVTQLCLLGGGGACGSKDGAAAAVRPALKIEPAEFDALVDILREELDHAELPTPAKHELLRRFAPLKPMPTASAT